MWRSRRCTLYVGMSKSTLLLELLGKTGQAEEQSVTDAHCRYLEDMAICVHCKTLAIEFGRETEGD
jgi:hypothetical protein